MPVTHTPPVPEPVEFSIEDAMVNWQEEPGGEYLRLDPPDLPPVDPPRDQS